MGSYNFISIYKKPVTVDNSRNKDLKHDLIIKIISRFEESTVFKTSKYNNMHAHKKTTRSQANG